VQDISDNYQFLYPFGWQEVSVSTADVVYKDVVEPLESVSVTITDTDKGDITEFGDIAEVRPGAGGPAGLGAPCDGGAGSLRQRRSQLRCWAAPAGGASSPSAPHAAAAVRAP
jgi:hypothetical protein